MGKAAVEKAAAAKKGSKKFAELKAAVEKAAAAKKGSNQDEDLEWGKWGKDKKAAGAKKFAELKAAAPKKFAELKAAAEKAAAAKKGSNQDEDLEWGKWGKDKKAAGAKK